ncbi:MAG: protein-tyrosine phosphatase family protein [Oscillochloridaceae bacterium umkhey_bin13]
MKLPHANCYLVAPGLVAGEYPGAYESVVAQQRVIDHLEAGLSYFIDLTEMGELKPYANLLETAAAEQGLAVVHQRMPIRDAGLPKHPDQMVAILDMIDTARAAGHNVYVHCWGGIGRTGTVVGCWLVRHGMSGPAALATIAAHWRGVAKSNRHPRSPETEAQHAYVRNWPVGK